MSNLATAFRFAPAPRAGSFRMPDHWVWCGSSARGDDGRYHLFASRWSKKDSFLHWATRSEIVRAVADRPEGPYTFQEVLIGRGGAIPLGPGGVAHNPTVHRCGPLWCLFFVYDFYDPSPNPADEAHFGSAWVQAWNRKITRLATAPGPEGPWTLQPQPLLRPRPGAWDAVIISNPAPCVSPDGSITLLYKSCDLPHPQSRYPGRFHLGVARAAGPAAPFTRLSDNPIELKGFADHHLEDPYLWWQDGHFHLLAKDMTGKVCGETQAGIHAVSDDAVHWELDQPPRAYSRKILWDDGSEQVMEKLERPQLLIENGRPTHLFAATLSKDAHGIRDSWNVVLPLA